MNKYTIIILILLPSSLAAGNTLDRHDYYSAGFSFRGGTLENNFVGKLKFYDYHLSIGYSRRFLNPFPVLKSSNTIDSGWGIRGVASQLFYKTNELREKTNSIEITPFVRLFFLQNGFFELGYSLEYFSTGNIIIRSPSSQNVYSIPVDKGFESGISIGAGYLIRIKDFIAIETRLAINMNNYVRSETEQLISGDIIRNIRFVIGVNLVLPR